MISFTVKNLLRACFYHSICSNPLASEGPILSYLKLLPVLQKSRLRRDDGVMGVTHMFVFERFTKRKKVEEITCFHGGGVRE